MNKLPAHTLLIAVLGLAGLSACGDRNAPATTQDPQAATKEEPKSFIGRAAKKGLDEAREKLRSENISISDVHIGGGDISIGDGNSSSGNAKPKAEITPQGDLLIEGAKVQANAEQQALLKQYRGHIENVAMIGMDIGEQSADIAGKALTEAFTGIFSGKTDQIEQKVEAEAEKIKVSAVKLCDQLPAMLETQQALAASMPEFKPYATMEQSDIDDCYNDEDLAELRAKTRHEVRDNIRGGVRSGIRGGIQSVAQAVGIARSGTGDTVTVDGVRVLLPPGGVSTDSSNGTTQIEVSNGLQVKLANGELWVNGDRYPSPKANGEVDLSADGTVKVDGKVVAAL